MSGLTLTLAGFRPALCCERFDSAKASAASWRNRATLVSHKTTPHLPGIGGGEDAAPGFTPSPTLCCRKLWEDAVILIWITLVGGIWMGLVA